MIVGAKKESHGLNFVSDFEIEKSIAVILFSERLRVLKRGKLAKSGGKAVRSFLDKSRYVKLTRSIIELGSNLRLFRCN
jgi:hypothetical protein